MNKRQKKKAISKLDVSLTLNKIGFTGQGPTAFDKRESTPPKNKSRITPREQRFIDKEIEKEMKFRKDAWRQVCIETLGEDPHELGEYPHGLAKKAGYKSTL